MKDLLTPEERRELMAAQARIDARKPPQRAVGVQHVPGWTSFADVSLDELLKTLRKKAG